MPHLDDDYRHAIVEYLERQHVRIVVIGESPYKPDAGPTHIPFMTETWEQLRRPVCSGQYVIQSLIGIWIHAIEQAQPRDSTPDWFATHCLLERYGIVLLNAMYSLVTDDDVTTALAKNTDASADDENKLRKATRDLLMKDRMREDWRIVNEQIISDIFQRCRPLVGVCGVTAYDVLEGEILGYGAERAEYLYHPSTLNVQGTTKYTRWLNDWDVGRLKERLLLYELQNR